MDRITVKHESITSVSVQSVGKVCPIEIPVKELGEFLGTLGEKVTQGDCGLIHEVKGKPERLYKIIPLASLKSGDEIRISEIAAQVGVAPTFHGAFLINQREERYVVIEMDHGGKTLGNWMEDFAESKAVNAATVSDEVALSPEQKKFRAYLEQLRKQDPYTIVEIKKKPRVDHEVAIAKMYDKPEMFYFELFSKLKVLAEKHISYGDTHAGNILPKPKMILIDFDGASIEESVQAAAQKTMQSAYTFTHFTNFRKLEGLSEDSIALLEWFQV